MPGVEVMGVGSEGEEMRNVGGVDEEAGIGDWPDRCDMVLLRDGTKNWKYRGLPDGIEIDWDQRNPKKSILTDNSHQELGSMLIAEAKIQEKPVPLLCRSSTNDRLQEKVRSYNKAFGTTRYEIAVTPKGSNFDPWSA